MARGLETPARTTTERPPGHVNGGRRANFQPFACPGGRFSFLNTMENEDQDTSTQLRVERISVENVFGITSFSVDPSGVTIIRGDNGTGKTSFLRAISLLLGGGKDPDALRKGAEKGEVRFELNDGTAVYARLTKNGTYYRIDGRGDVTARALLNRVQDEVSVNPISIIQARAKDRGRILLEAMPMQVDRTEVVARVPDGVKIPDVDWGAHALDVLGDKSRGVIGTLYDERQEIGGAKRTKEGAVKDLSGAVEDVRDPKDIRSDREAVEREIKDAEAKKDEEISEIFAWERKRVEEIRKEAGENREMIRREHDEAVSPLHDKSARLSEEEKAAESAMQTKRLVEKRRSELQGLKAEYAAYTEAIETLRDMRTSFSDDLPQGVSVGEDGEIYDAEDVPFANWNEETQIRFACRIAYMRKGELGLIPVDGIEKLVGAQREAFLEWASSQDDAQFILTEAVAGADLAAETVGA